MVKRRSVGLLVSFVILMRDALKRALIPVVIVALFVASTTGRRDHVYATDTPLLAAVEQDSGTLRGDPQGLPAAAMLAARAASAAARNAAVRRAVTTGARWLATALLGDAIGDHVWGLTPSDGYVGLDDSVFDF